MIATMLEERRVILDHVHPLCCQLTSNLFNSGCFSDSEDPMSLSTTRPSTSKSRGICRYYTHPRGCFAADKCKFLHGEPPIEAKPDDPPMLTPYDKAKRCEFYARGLTSLALCDPIWLMACCQGFARGEMHAGSYMYQTGGNLATICR